MADKTPAGRPRPKRLKILLTLTLFTSTAIAAPQQSPSWVDEYQRAVDQIRQGDISIAMERFEDLWKSNSGAFVLANAIGTALDAAGHHEEATGWYLKALALNPSYASAHNNLGLNYIARKQFEKAVESLKRAGELDPENGRVSYNLGLVRLQLEEFAEAARAFRMAHQRMPQASDPLSRLAYASFRAGEVEEGRRALDSLVQLPGDREKSLLAALRILNDVKRYEETLARARQAKGSIPFPPPLVIEEAKALFHLGQYEETVEALRGISQRQSSSAGYYLLLGSAQALDGDLPSAVRSFQEALRLAPDNPEGYYRLSLVYLAGFRDQEAVEVLHEGLKQIPSSPLILNGLATVSENLGRFREAIEYLQRSLKGNRRQPEVWAKVGELHTELGQYDDAGVAYEQAVKLGASPQTMAQYADLLIRFRKLEEAERVLHQALRDSPTVPGLYISLGKMRNLQGYYTEAEGALRRALELDTEDGNAHLLLGRVLHRLGKDDEAQREIARANQLKETARQRRITRGMLTPLTASTQ